MTRQNPSGRNYFEKNKNFQPRSEKQYSYKKKGLYAYMLTSVHLRQREKNSLFPALQACASLFKSREPEAAMFFVNV